ncbi:MAG TPA: GlxA family transcriptional regulator [Acetobacteraceae bacterium]|nr:GlxA family transcriptional regulator [Acetobacteraceae bacterium]
MDTRPRRDPLIRSPNLPHRIHPDAARTRADHEYRPGFLELLSSEAGAQTGTPPQLRVSITLLPRFTMLAFAGFVDALRLAGDIGDRSRPNRCSWTLVGSDRHPVTASCGAAVAHWETFADPRGFDYVVVVGGLLDDGLDYDAALLRHLRQAARLGVPIVGICTGVFAMARAGVLDDHRCCVHGYHLADFAERFPAIRTVSDQLYVVDGDRVTCAGGAAAIDLAGHLIERHCGRERARKIMPHLLVDELRPGGHSQLLLLDEFFNIYDERVRAAVLLMEQCIADSLSVSDIARRVGVPPRQLERAFRRCFNLSPSGMFRLMRLRRARWLVLHSSLTITEIACACGFADTAHLTRSFKREYRLLPTKLRHSLGARDFDRPAGHAAAAVPVADVQNPGERVLSRRPFVP